MPDKRFVPLILFTNENYRICKTDNLVPFGVGNQYAIELMSFFILFHLQLHRLVVTARQAAQVLEIMAVEGRYNIIPVRYATDELLCPVLKKVYRKE